VIDSRGVNAIKILAVGVDVLLRIGPQGRRFLDEALSCPTIRSAWSPEPK
jgi:hypothetical protein